MTPPQKLEKIGRYQVLEKVGKGGMGVLYRGFDPVLDREVAIKLMLTDFSDDTEQMRPRFYREARAAAKLNHRNIVTIFEFAEENNVPYIVMEFLRGVPLGARMGTQPSLTLDDKLNVIAQLCDGLSYAHEQGVVHRDVKPDNVFLLEDGSIKLLDFGIAKLTSSTLTRQGDVLGSASYMSPEQVGGSESVDGRADIFSAGIMLYELLSGRRPFEGGSPTAVILKILKEDPTPIETVTTSMPPGVVAIVMRALQKDPADRYQSAEEMARDLQSLRKSLHPSLSTAQAQMDETRFASTQVIKTLHEDFLKSRVGGTTVSKAGTSVTRDGTAVSQDATAAREAPAAAKASGGLVPALVGGVVVLALMVAAIGAVVGLRFLDQSTPGAGDTASESPGGIVAAPPPSTEAGGPAATTDPTLPAPVADPAALASATPAALPPAPDALPGAAAGAASALPQPAPAAPASAQPQPSPVATQTTADPPVGTATAVKPLPDPTPGKPADAAAALKGASGGPGAPTTASLVEPGTLFIDFLNTYSEGEIEVEIPTARKRWSQRLGLGPQGGGIAKRASEPIAAQLKIPPGAHRITVTILNAGGEVRDFGGTTVNVEAARSVTLRIRTTRFKNQLQLELIAGEPVPK